MAMLYLMVIVTGLLGMLALRLLLARLIGDGHLSRRLRVAALVGAAAGLTAGLVGAHQLAESWERRNWPQVEGVVVRSELVGERNYRPEVQIAYAVAGVRYATVSNLGATGFGSKRSRYDVAKQLIAKYPPGREVVVRHDPSDPGRAVLLVRPSFQSFVLAAVGVLLLAVGGGLVSVSSRSVARE
jgi:hypothetical protein